MITNWDARFMGLAELIALWSKDPNAKVGCVIADIDNNHLSSGFNGFPRGVSDNERLQEREVKIKLIVHAEANAVAAAARNGHSVKGSTAFVTLPCCSQCAGLLIQSGVRRVVFRRDIRIDGTISKWQADRDFAIAMFQEVGIVFEEM